CFIPLYSLSLCTDCPTLFGRCWCRRPARRRGSCRRRARRAWCSRGRRGRVVLEVRTVRVGDVERRDREGRRGGGALSLEVVDRLLQSDVRDVQDSLVLGQVLE